MSSDSILSISIFVTSICMSFWVPVLISAAKMLRVNSWKSFWESTVPFWHFAFVCSWITYGLILIALSDYHFIGMHISTLAYSFCASFFGWVTRRRGEWFKKHNITKFEYIYFCPFVARKITRNISRVMLIIFFAIIFGASDWIYFYHNYTTSPNKDNAFYRLIPFVTTHILFICLLFWKSKIYILVFKELYIDHTSSDNINHFMVEKQKENQANILHDLLVRLYNDPLTLKECEEIIDKYIKYWFFNFSIKHNKDFEEQDVIFEKHMELMKQLYENSSPALGLKFENTLRSKCEKIIVRNKRKILIKNIFKCSNNNIEDNEM